MAYDPQANHRRPQPEATAVAPVDALLGDAPATAALPGGVRDDPPPTPGVTPAPADPPSDTLLLNTGLVAAAGTVVALLTLRHLWKRHLNRRTTDTPN